MASSLVHLKGVDINVANGEFERNRWLVKPWIREEHYKYPSGGSTVDQLYTLFMVLKGPCQFAQQVFRCFVDLGGLIYSMAYLISVLL